MQSHQGGHKWKIRRDGSAIYTKERHMPRSIPIREDLLYFGHLGRATQAPTRSGLTPRPSASLYARPGFLYRLLGSLL
jgi:hypothetical protein